MALKKNDLLLLLAEMQAKGIEVSSQIKKLVNSTSLPLETLKFINDQRPLDIVEFYRHIRHNYNNKKSSLYINIVREIEDPQEVLVTLSALLTQILLWSKKLEDRQLFLESSRAREISLVLNNYFETYDITQAMQLLKLIKADLTALEVVAGTRS